MNKTSKWLTANLVFTLGWLVANHPLDDALGIKVGSAADWTLYMSVLILVSAICSIGAFSSKE